MKEGLRSRTLLKRAKDKVDSSSKNCNEATTTTTSVGDQAKKGSYLNSVDSVLLDYSAMSSPESKIEDNAEADADKGRRKFGKGQRGRKRKNMESPKRGDGTIDKEKIGVTVISNDSDSANDIVLTPPERKIEEGSGTDHMECCKGADAGVELGVNANGDANTHVGNDKERCELGEGLLGEKKGSVENSKKVDASASDADEGKIEPPLISSYSDHAKDLVISSKGSGTEHVECTKDAGVGVEVGANDSGLGSANDIVFPSLERKAEQVSGTGHVELSKDADVGVEVGVNPNSDANTHDGNGKDRSELGKGPYPEKGDVSDADEEMQSPLVSSYSDHAKHLVVSSLEKVEEGGGTEHVEGIKDTCVGVEVGVNANSLDSANDIVLLSPEREVEEGNETEHVECSKDGDIGDDVNTLAGNVKDRREVGKGRRGRKRKKVENPKKGDDAVSNAEEGSGTEHVQCSKDSGVAVDVGIKANGDANTDNEKDTRKFGKPRRGRKRKKVANPKKGDVVTCVAVKGERGSPLSSYGMDSVKERSGSEHVECSKDTDSGVDVGVYDDGNANANADKIMHKPRNGRQGKKRKKVESSECNEDDEAGRKKAKDVKVQVIGRILRSRTMATSSGQKVVDSGRNGGVVGGKINKEIDESDKEMVDTQEDESVQPIGRLRKKLKGRRGRPPKLRGIDTQKVESDRPIGKLRKKLKGRRGRPPKLQGIDTDKDENYQPFAKPRKKLKGRRGRPPKLQGENGASEVICKGKLKVGRFKKTTGRPKDDDISKGSKFPDVWKKNGASEVISNEKHKVMGSNKVSDQPNSKDTVKGSNLTEDGRDNRITSLSRQAGMSSTGKKLKMIKHRKGEMGRRQEQQLVREQIIDILMKAGWTIQYRPRQTKEYSDAVYVDPEGKTHWSVTLAYHKLKKKVEDGGADSRTMSAFTPIPEEVLSKLFRVRREEKKKKGKKKGKGPGKSGSKADKGDTLHWEKDNSVGRSLKGMPRFSRKERPSRKPCALLARTAEKGLGSDIGGFIPYNGKRSLLSWMIDLGTVVSGEKVLYMNHSKSRVMIEGRITRDGIQCGCCNEILKVSDFESHSGSKLCQPFYNIYIESGISLLQCLADSWSKQEKSDRIGFHFVNVDGDDPNDDTCNLCGDGGNLICCDGCPSTFHQDCLDIEVWKFPSGNWQCVYCSCKFCGTVAGNTCQRNDNNDRIVSELLSCHLCEEKFHLLCVQGEDAINVESKCKTFCGRKCYELFEQLQVLLGVKHELEEGFSWTLLQRSDVGRDISCSSAPLKVECNSKLAVAFSIMDECFLPIVDQRSGINMIHNVVYGCGSNFSRLNYSGFFTAVLERGDEIISAASIRIHGNQLAEMPFIGTRHMYRRQGMCRRLLNAIESALCFLDVEKLVIPAISELFQTWTSVFGFMPVEESKRQEMKGMNMIVFPGTDMLQKLKNQFAKGNIIPVADVKFNVHKDLTMHEGPINTDLGLSVAPDSNNSPEAIVQHASRINEETAGVESSLHLPNGSLNDTSDTSGTVILRESTANDTSLVHLSMVLDNKLVTESEGPASVTPELVEQQTLEGIDSNNVLPDEKIVQCNSKLKNHSIHKLESKPSTFSQVESDAMNCEAKTAKAMEEGKEAVDCEQKREAKYFNHDRNSLAEGSIQYSSDGKHEIQLHHNSHGVMVRGNSPSHQERVDVNDSDATFSDDGNSYPCMSNELCKPLELLSGVDNDGIPGVKASSSTCPVGVSHKTSCEVTGNNSFDLNEDLTATQTDIHSLDGDSPPNRPQLCSKSSEQSVSGSQVHFNVTLRDTEPLCNSSSCGISEVGGSCRLLKSGNQC